MTLTWGTGTQPVQRANINNDEIADSSFNIKSSQCKILHRGLKTIQITVLASTWTAEEINTLPL